MYWRQRSAKYSSKRRLEVWVVYNSGPDLLWLNWGASKLSSNAGHSVWQDKITLINGAFQDSNIPITQSCVFVKNPKKCFPVHWKPVHYLCSLLNNECKKCNYSENCLASVQLYVSENAVLRPFLSFLFQNASLIVHHLSPDRSPGVEVLHYL